MLNQSRLVRLNSKDKAANSASNSDFKVYLKNRVLLQEVKAISFISASVPNVFYNVRSDTSQGYTNNLLYIEQDGEAKTSLSVSEGQYTTSTFMSALKIAIDAVLTGGSTVAIAQDSTTQRLTFTFSGGTNPNTILYDSTDGPSSLAEVIGLVTTTAQQAVSTMTSLPDLAGLPEVFIHSKELADGMLIDGNSGAIAVLGSVSFHSTPFGGTAYFLSNDESLFSLAYNGVKNLSNIHIILRDSEGNRLDIGTNDMNIIFKIYT